MYEEMVKALRYCNTGGDGCVDCSYADTTGCIGVIREKAADAIEDLTDLLGCYEGNTDMALVEEDRMMVVRFLPKWIPVTERLPKAYEEVLLLFPHNQAAGFCDRDGCWGVYSGDGFYTEVADNEPKPTHWARKLPEPPKEEKTNV